MPNARHKSFSAFGQAASRYLPSSYVVLLLLFALATVTASAQTIPHAAILTPTDSTDGQQPTYYDPISHVGVYDRLSDDMFPAEWHAPRIDATASPMAGAERDRALRLVKIALSKYPSEFLQANLKRVYLLGELKFRGVSVAATNSATCLYIVVKAGNPFYTDAFVEETFHHEFGHLIQRNYRRFWSPDAWMACNPPNFHYGAQDGVDAVRNGHASEWITDEWSRQGFLSEYGAEDAAEDFAIIASHLFLGDASFWSRVQKFPALAKKIGVVMAFYGKLNRRFTEAYFHSLRSGQPDNERRGGRTSSAASPSSFLPIPSLNALSDIV